MSRSPPPSRGRTSPTTPSMKAFWLSKKAAEEACKPDPSMNHRDRARIVFDYRKAYQAFMLETQSGGEWTVVGEDFAKKRRARAKKKLMRPLSQLNHCVYKDYFDSIMTSV